MLPARKKKFAFVNEYINANFLKEIDGKYVFGSWDVKDPDPLGPELPYLKQYRLGKGINITHDYWNCVSERALDELAAYADYISTDSRVLTRDHFDLFLEKMREHPHKFYHRALIEADTMTNWDAHPAGFRDHREAMEWWTSYVLNEQIHWSDPVTGKTEYLKDIRSALLPGGNMAEYIKRGMPCREFQFVACAGEVWSLHQHLEWGFDAITLERNLLCGNVNVGVAFLRGAAWQYGDRKWGMDPTCWVDFHWPDFMPTCFNEQGRQMGGVSPELSFREWLAARMNGADFVHQIFSEFGFFNRPFKPQEKRVLSPVGRKAVEFQALLEGPLADVGRAIVPMALVLDRNHGWSESRWDRDFPFGKKLPYLPSDKSIGSFFDFMFPGYRLGTRNGMSYYQKDLPWFGYKERLAALKRGEDLKIQEKGIMSRTRHGDVVDVLVDSARSEALGNYPLVMVLGGLTVTEQHWAELERYVKEGGTLVVSVSHYEPGKTAIGGFEVVASYQHYEGKTQCHLCGAMLNDYCYEYSRVKVLEGTTALLSSEDDYNGTPALAVERKLGKGRIITSLVYHYSILLGEQLTPSVQHLLDHLIEPLMPFRIEGEPVHAIYSRSESSPGDFYVTLMNHHESPWKGVVKPRSGKIVAAKEVIAGRKYQVKEEGVKVRVKPYQVAVLKVRISLG